MDKQIDDLEVRARPYMRNTSFTSSPLASVIPNQIKKEYALIPVVVGAILLFWAPSFVVDENEEDDTREMNYSAWAISTVVISMLIAVLLYMKRYK
jgi:heme O synthase-like polyprenyltransferase